MVAAYGIFKTPLLLLEVRDLYNRYKKGEVITNAETGLFISQVASTALNTISLFTNAIPHIKLAELAARAISLPFCYLTDDSLAKKAEYTAGCAFSFMRITQEKTMLLRGSLASQAASRSLYAANIGEFICYNQLVQKFYSWAFSSRYIPIPSSSQRSSSSLEEPVSPMPLRPDVFSWPPIINWWSWVPLDERPIIWRLGNVPSASLPKNWKELCQQMNTLDKLDIIPSYIECDASESSEMLTKCSITHKLTANPVIPNVEDSLHKRELPCYDEEAFSKWQKEHPGISPPGWPEDLVKFSLKPNVVSIKYVNKAYLRQIKQNFFKNSSINTFISLYKNSDAIVITPFYWNLIAGGGSIGDVAWLRKVPSDMLNVHICPITLEPIADPVEDPTSEGGKIFYERSAILNALKISDKSPITRKHLTASMLRECAETVKETFREARATLNAF